MPPKKICYNLSMTMSNVEVSAQPLPTPDVANFKVTPGQDPQLTADIFRIIGTKSKALVLTGFATGTTPSSLNPHIRDLTQKGIPVFILSNNPMDHHGIGQIKYEVQQEAVEAGGIPLRNPNVTNDEEVTTSIQEAINEGKTGPELAQAMIEKFGSVVEKIEL